MNTGEYVIERVYDHSWSTVNGRLCSSPVYLLSARLPVEQAEQLREVAWSGVKPYRGTPVFRGNVWNTVTVSGFEVTEDEARRIRAGEDPVGVITAFPACGYLLRAVPVPVSSS